MDIDGRTRSDAAHTRAAPSPGFDAPAQAPRGADESAGDYVERIRRYVCGETPQPGVAAAAPPVLAAQCRRVLDNATAEFAPWLERAGTTVTEIIGATPAQLAAVLNHMQCPPQRLTMSSATVLDNVLTLARDVIARRVPGDFIEVGAWRGGVGVLMRAVIAAYAHADEPRRVAWIADSFAGLPRPDPARHLDDAVLHHVMLTIDGLHVDRDAVERGFERAGLLDDQVGILAGWFADTLPDAPIDRLALARLDGDWYESTMTALDALYPRLSPGGFLIVDDYGLPTGCSRAVDEYRAIHGIAAPLQRVDQQAVFWCKSR